MKSQYISYIFSCTVADILAGRRVAPSFVTGYSMGIYAALYYCGAFSFTDGLNMIRIAWEKISGATGNGRYGMGMIVGLTEADILRLTGSGKDAGICNRNNPHTFIISGKYEAVESILSAAREEGALRASLLPVSKPYHSEMLRPASIGFREAITGMDIKNPVPAYFSNISREIITMGEGLREELITNLYTRMNWYETMKALIGKEVEAFYECGAGNGLTKNFRFIDGNYKAFSVERLDQFSGVAGNFPVR